MKAWSIGIGFMADIVYRFNPAQLTYSKFTEFELAFHESWFADQLCPFADRFK